MALWSHGSLLFKIYLNGLFFLVDFTEICNFADVTFFVCDKDLVSLNRLEHDSFFANEWIQIDYMSLNKDKINLFVAAQKHENFGIKIGEAKIWEFNKQKLSEVQIDAKLPFDRHVWNL